MEEKKDCKFLEMARIMTEHGIQNEVAKKGNLVYYFLEFVLKFL